MVWQVPARSVKPPILVWTPALTCFLSPGEDFTGHAFGVFDGPSGESRCGYPEANGKSKSPLRGERVWVREDVRPISAERELSQLAARGMAGDGWDDFQVLGLATCCGLGQSALLWNHSVWETVFGATPKTATGTGALPSNVPAGRPMAVCGGRTGQRAVELFWSV